jgi:hypothetical protein
MTDARPRSCLTFAYSEPQRQAPSDFWILELSATMVGLNELMDTELIVPKIPCQIRSKGVEMLQIPVTIVSETISHAGEEGHLSVRT